MSVTVAGDGSILLSGLCPIEDAETLLRCLAADPQAAVDWSGCDQAHTAVVQVLMAARRRMVGTPAEPFLRLHVSPQLGAA